MGDLLKLRSATASMLEKIPNLPSGQVAPYSCDSCRDSGWVAVIGEDGRERGVKECLCLQRRKQSRLLERIPPAYRDLSLETINPRPERHSKQAGVFDALKCAPHAPYLLFGRNGAGKSLIGWLLYRRAVEEGRPASALSLSELLASFRRWEMGGDAPLLDAESLRQAGGRRLIFLDEFDKARPTEFAGESLFNLLDAAYTYRHQVVITSNLAPRQLQDHWERSSEYYGSSIMRRLCELEGAVIVEMY